jgi:hypothetical protein
MLNRFLCVVKKDMETIGTVCRFVLTGQSSRISPSDRRFRGHEYPYIYIQKLGPAGDQMEVER